MTSPLPPGPPPPANGQPIAVEASRALRPVVALLFSNLALSVLLTIATLIARHSIVNYQLDHRHITDPALRETLRKSYGYSIIGRVVGNIVVSVVYVFLV